MIVLIAVSLVVVLTGVVFAVDVAYMHLNRTELKTVTDLAAQAAVEALTREQSEVAAVAAAQRVAALHQVAGRSLQLATGDIELGRHAYNGQSRLTFDPGATPYTTVRVNGRLTSGSANGAVSTFFASAFGLASYGVERTSTATQVDRDICLVLDISTSMSGDGRFEAMIDAAHAFLDEVDLSYETEHVSLVTYNNKAQRVQELTNSTSVLRTALDSVAINESGTAIGEGLKKGIDSLKGDAMRRPLAYQEIVLMTDGNHNTGVHPLDVVPNAVAEKFVVHTVTFSSDADQNLMLQVANGAGGRHIHADSSAQLTTAFQNMARSVELQLID
jgi:Mg-chelatase subunit ChlD